MLQKGTADRGRGPEGKTRLRGSWAGAMGQCQFMPTSFRDYALDYDGDGHKGTTFLTSKSFRLFSPHLILICRHDFG